MLFTARIATWLLTFVSVCVAFAPSSSRPAALMNAVCEMSLVAPAPWRVRFLVAAASPTVNAAFTAMLPPVCNVTLPVAALVVVAADTVMPPVLVESPMTSLPAVMRLSSPSFKPSVREPGVAEPTSALLILICAAAESVFRVTVPVLVANIEVVADVLMSSVSVLMFTSVLALTMAPDASCNAVEVVPSVDVVMSILPLLAVTALFMNATAEPFDALVFVPTIETF